MRLHLGVLVDHAAGARLAGPPAPGGERAETRGHVRRPERERRRVRRQSPYRQAEHDDRRDEKSSHRIGPSDPGAPCPGVSGVASHARRSLLQPTLRPCGPTHKPARSRSPDSAEPDAATPPRGVADGGAIAHAGHAIPADTGTVTAPEGARALGCARSSHRRRDPPLHRARGRANCRPDDTDERGSGPNPAQPRCPLEACCLGSGRR